MKLLLILLFSSGFSFFSVSSKIVKKAPVFKTFTASGTIYVPYPEIVEPFTIWYDATINKSRIDYYGGMVKTYQDANANPYKIARRIVPVTTEETTNVPTCFETHRNNIEIQSIIPDLSDFEPVGNKVMDGKNCEIWRKNRKTHKEADRYVYITWQKNNKTNENEPIPVMYVYKKSLSSGNYYFTFDNFNSDSPDPSAFSLPKGFKCTLFNQTFIENHEYVKSFNPMREFINDDISHVDHAWNEFQKHHRRGKEYKDDKEYQFRKNIFHQNFRLIQSKNRANLGYKLAVNHLADRTSEELNNMRGLKPNRTDFNGTKAFPYSADDLATSQDKLPDNFDWRIRGAVSPVRNQLNCGSCWSFSAIGALEGAYFIKNGYRIHLSEQALMDCSWGFHNLGCSGGDQGKALEWVEKHGIPSDDVYGPYLEEDGYCHIKNMTMAAHTTGTVRVPEDELALKTALVNHGPIAIAIDARRDFKFYSSGVYYSPNCSSKDLDHAVLLVGYGDLNGKPYWLVKNSWSDQWGNDGYILMSRQNNNCGVMTQAFYPTM